MKELKSMRIKSIYLLYFMVLPIFMMTTISSCSSNKGHTMKNKKLKRGQRIPCPVKDC